jgi:hypothetical protein
VFIIMFYDPWIIFVQALQLKKKLTPQIKIELLRWFSTNKSIKFGIFALVKA